MFPTYKKLTAIAGSILLGSAVNATGLDTKEVYHVDLDVFADFSYDLLGFDAKEYVEYLTGAPYTNAEFEAEYPIFQGANSYEVNGFGSLDYDIYHEEIAPEFDLGEKYNWNVSIKGGWGYEAFIATQEDPFFDYFEGGEDNVMIDFDIPDVAPVDLFGFIDLSPLEMASGFSALVSGVPGSEGLAQAITIAGSTLSLLPLITEDGDVTYFSDLGYPYGFVDIAIHNPVSIPENLGGPIFNGPLPELINALDYLDSGAYLDIHLSASKAVFGPHSVPDSGTSIISALAGFGILALLRFRRFA